MDEQEARVMLLPPVPWSYQDGVLRDANEYPIALISIGVSMKYPHLGEMLMNAWKRESEIDRG